MTDRLSVSGIKKYLGESGEFSLTVLPEVTSTNTAAKQAAESGAPHFSVFIADRQTAGRGRLGRSFFSPGGTGLYISVVLRPESGADTAMITSAAAVCMAEAIERVFGVSPEIKWVNDLLICGKKVCGILTEASFSGKDRPDFVILGAGVNVYPPHGGFPEFDNNEAASLSDTVTEDGRCRLAAAFLERIFARYDGIFRGEHMDEYRRRCNMVGKEVQLVSAGKTAGAKILGIGDDCSLSVEYENGERGTVVSGEVSIRKKSDI